MQNSVFLAFFAALFTWFVTALGAGTVVFFKKNNENIMNIMLGFSAGVMIAASFWSLLEPAIEKSKIYLSFPAFLVVSIGFVSGALFMWLADKTVGLARRNIDSEKGKNDKLNRIIMLCLSITLHNIPEGLAIGVAFGALGTNASPDEIMAALSVALGIGIQNFPEGAAVSLPLRMEGQSRKKSFFVGQASGMVEPLASVIGALLVVGIRSLLPYALSFAAGAMILVAVHELIPECQKARANKPYFATFGIISGFTVMMLLDVALG